MNKTINFHNVGQLREALKDLPAERLIINQVTATNGQTYNMWGSFCPQVPNGTIAALTLSHDELKSLQTLEEEGSCLVLDLSDENQYFVKLNGEKVFKPSTFGQDSKNECLYWIYMNSYSIYRPKLTIKKN